MTSHSPPNARDREPAGNRSGEGAHFNWPIEMGKAREFGLACLDPLFSDPTHVPITFPEVATHFWEPPESRSGFGDLDLSRLLHGEQEFVYDRPIMIGENLAGYTRLKDQYVKEGRRGGNMRFTIYETVFVDQNEAVVMRSTRTLVEVRERPDD